MSVFDINHYILDEGDTYYGAEKLKALGVTIRGSGGLMGGKGGSGENADNTLQSNSIVRLVELISEGPCEGLVSIDGNSDTETAKRKLERSILFDKTPLMGRNKRNFKNVEWEQRFGFADQAHLKGHAGVETPYDVNTQVTRNGGPVIQTITNDDVDAVMVIMRIPALVKQKEKDGTLQKTDVSYEIDVKPNGGDWTLVKSVDIKNEKTTSAYQLVHRIALPDILVGEPEWQIRVRRLTADSDDEKLANETWWDSYTTRVEGKFIYPHCALVAFEVNAEDFGTSLPERRYRFRGLKVSVPENYDPITRTYTGNWNGEFKRAWTNNPAWVFYDILTNNRYGLGEFVKASIVDKWSLYAIAQYCDEMVKTGLKNKNGNPIREPRYTYNGVIQNREEAWKVLQSIASAWRGMAYWNLGQIFAVSDMPADAKHLVTPANVIGGEFDYSGTAKKARHSVALVSYNDFDNYSDPAVEAVVHDDALEEFGWREKQVQLQGCSSRTLAMRYGEWILDTERFATETVQYTASWDQALAVPGDIIAVADPRKANARMGGRLKDVDLNTLTLDAPFKKNNAETYGVYVVLSSGEVVERAVSGFTDEAFDGDGNSLGFTKATLATALPSLPVVGSLYIFKGSSSIPRLYRVLQVKRQEKNTFQVTALTHDPGKYARVERDKNVAPPQDPSTRDNDAPWDLKFDETTVQDDKGRIRTQLDVSWKKPAARFFIKDYEVQVNHPRKGWLPVRHTKTNHIEIDNALKEEYGFRIVARSQFGMRSEALEGTYLVTGEDTLPVPEVTDLELSEKEGAPDLIFEGRSIEIQWKNKMARSSKADATDNEKAENYSSLYDYTLVKVIDTDSGEFLRQFKMRGRRYTYTFRNNRADNKKDGRPVSRNVTFKVQTFDLLGRQSNVATLNVTNPAPAAPSFSVTQRGTTMQVRIDKPDADDIEGYLVWMSTSPGFTPAGQTAGAGNCVHNGGRTPVIDVKRGRTYYVIVAAYDSFGTLLLNYSAQVATVAGQTVTDGDAPSMPTGLSAVSVGDSDKQGHIRSMIKFGWTAHLASYPTETFFDHYEIEIQEDGDEYNSAKRVGTKLQFRGKIDRVYRFRIRACDSLGNKSAYTAWQAPGSFVLAAGDTTGPEKAVILGAVGRRKGMKLTVAECAATDYKVTRYWRYTSLANALAHSGTALGGQAGEVFFDGDNLSDSTEYWYRCRHVDKSGNLGELSDPFSSVTGAVETTEVADGSITDPKIDQTAPATPNAPVLVQRNTDLNKDGKVDIAIRGTVTLLATGLPAKSVDIEIFEDGVIHDTKSAPVRSDNTAVFNFPAKTGKAYTAIARTSSGFRKNSAWSTTSNSVTPVGKGNTFGTPPAPSLLARKARVKATIAQPSNDDYKATRLWRYTSSANASADSGGVMVAHGDATVLFDDEDLIIGFTYYYRAQYVDTSGNPSVKGAVAGVTFTGSNITESEITGSISDAKLSGMSAAKIAGLIASGQISSLATNKLTGTIVNGQIATGAIATTNIILGSVSLWMGAETAGIQTVNATTWNEIQSVFGTWNVADAQFLILMQFRAETNDGYRLMVRFNGSQVGSTIGFRAPTDAINVILEIVPISTVTAISGTWSFHIQRDTSGTANIKNRKMIVGAIKR